MPKILNYDEIQRTYGSLKVDGYTQRQAAKQMGISPVTLGKILRGKVKERQISSVKQKIINYYFHKNNLGLTEIAKIMNCSRQYIFKVIDEHKKTSDNTLS